MTEAEMEFFPKGRCIYLDKVAVNATSLIYSPNFYNALGGDTIRCYI